MSLSNDPGLRTIAKERCRNLRRNETEAEKCFWKAVRNRRFLGLKFRRQHPIFFDYLGKETFYIADFYCHEKALVVEIDGKIHDFQIAQDRFRTMVINLKGIQVVRFENAQVLNNPSSVLKELAGIIEDL